LTEQEILKGPAPAVALLWQIRKLLQQQIPKGQIVIHVVTVTEMTRLDFTEIEPYQPLFSIILINRGPDSAEFSLNGGRWYTIEDYESLPEIGFRIAAIKTVDFRVQTGKTAKMKVIGKY